MEKKCTKCGIVKCIDEFHKKSSLNTKGRHSRCKECAIAGAKADYWRRKEAILPSMTLFNRNKKEQLRLAVGELKKELGCCVCGENDPCCLDCHHMGDKQDTIAGLVTGKNVAKLVAELNKCVCVCANCHRKIHAGRTEANEQNTIQISMDEFNLVLNEIKQSLPDTGSRRKPVYEKPKKQCSCGEEILKESKQCNQCRGLATRKVDRPSKEVLAKLLWEKPTMQIGKMYGVSDKAVEKWAKKYELTKPGRGYWAQIGK